MINDINYLLLIAEEIISNLITVLKSNEIPFFSFSIQDSIETFMMNKCDNVRRSCCIVGSIIIKSLLGKLVIITFTLPCLLFCYFDTRSWSYLSQISFANLKHWSGGEWVLFHYKWRDILHVGLQCARRLYCIKVGYYKHFHMWNIVRFTRTTS